MCGEMGAIWQTTENRRVRTSVPGKANARWTSLKKVVPSEANHSGD